MFHGSEDPRRATDHHPRRQRRGRWLTLRTVMAAVLALLMTAALGSSAVAATGRRHADVSILPVALLTDGSGTMTVSMAVRCPPTDHMIEGFVTVEQGDISLLTGFEVVCDGRRHLTQATFSSSDAGAGPFRAGRADLRASLFDEHTGTSVAESSRTVLVKG